MTNAELKTRIADLLELSKKEADDILWALNEVCIEIVKEGGSVTLPGVGKLSCAVRPARKARNPRTGEPVQVPAKVALKFALSKTLKDQAPAIKSKVGRQLLDEAEERQAAAAKRKRQREREAAKGTTTKRTGTGRTVAKKSTTVKKRRLSRT